MNKVKTLSAILLLAITFSISSCASDDAFDEISVDTELNQKSPTDPDDKEGEEEDDPTNG